MKTMLTFAMAIVTLLFPALCLSAHAQGTAFTYQGRLLDNGSPANGNYDLTFAVFNVPNLGNPVSANITNGPLVISNGLFTVTLDFGAGVFDGNPRWLQIGVRTNVSDPFTLLSPRQALSPTPYAVLAGNVPDFAITSNKLAPAAVGSAQLAPGAVQAGNIATGAVTTVELAKPPRSGSVSSGALAIDFGQADFSVTFTPAFNSTPSVTLGLQPGFPPSLGEQSALYLKTVSPSGFTGRFSSVATVQKLSEYGVSSSLAIVNGTPAVCAAGTPASVQYLRATDFLGTYWSYPIKLDLNTGGADDMQMAVVDGNPAIAYHSGSGVLKFIRATDVNGASWGSPTTIIATNGYFISLAVVNGNPAITYYETPNSDLKYVRATDADGTAWATPVAVDTAGQVGRYCSLAVIDGYPAISYEDLSNGNLKFVRATDADGTTWGTPLVLDTDGGVSSSLNVANGNPAIAYADGVNIKFIRATDASGTAWGTPVLVDQHGGDISLRIVNGTPAISYMSDGLRYAHAADANGATWRTPALLDAEGTGGGGTSLIVLPTGAPAISYYSTYTISEPSGTLRFVREPSVSFNINWIALEP